MLLLHLREGGVDPDYARVETPEELKAALKSGHWDAVFADYSLPSFSALDALRIVQNSRLDLPFIIVSGVIGEEQAVEALKAGAHDFILKGQYARLVPALERALRDAVLRHERRQTAEELSRHREHLEELVQLRTEELQVQSEELQAQNEELQAQGEELSRYLDEIERVNKGLRESEEQIRLLVDGVQDYAIFMLDPQGRVLTWNEGAERIKGYRTEEIVGRHFSCFYCREDVAHGKPEHELKMAVTEGRYGDEGCRFRKDGSQFWASVVITALHDDKGNLRGFSKVTRDISERKQSEEALKRAHDELEKRVEERTAELCRKDQMLLLQSRLAAMGEMIGNIAHQWRQPLNTLGLYIQSLELLYESGDLTKEMLTTTTSESMRMISHMSQTVSDFMNYFSPDKDKVEFNVRESIANTLSLMEGTLQNPKVSVEFVAKDDPVIYGYRNEFAQVLINILNNARDAFTEGKFDDPRVTITVGGEKGCAVVTVADNAGGIPEEIIGKIFDPYFTTKGSQQGTGIGLFMSKAIIEKNMGGRIAVRNIADGAEFRIEVCDGIHD